MLTPGITRQVPLFAFICLCGAATAPSQDVFLPPPPGADWTRLPPILDPVTAGEEASLRQDAVPAPPPQTSPTAATAESIPATVAPSPSDRPATGGAAAELDVIDQESDPGTWFVPYRWIDATEWDGSFELGLNGTDGNSEAFTLRTGGNLKRKTKVYEIGGDVTYLKTTTAGVESLHRLLSNSKYERFFGESRWSCYLKSFLEYDEFAAFDVRLIGNAGLGYQVIRTDHLTLKTRLGAGASREFGGPDDDVKPEAAFGCDYDWKLTDRQKVAAVWDYYPAWSDFEDYRMVTSLNWECLLDKVANLSLKLSVSDRYDSTPYDRRANDIDYALLLLWKI